MIRFLHQPLHIVVNLHHLLISAFDIIAKLVKRLILVISFGFEVLCLSLDHIGRRYNFINFLVLFANVSFLLIEHLTCIQVACVVILIVFAALRSNKWLLLVS